MSSRTAVRPERSSSVFHSLQLIRFLPAVEVSEHPKGYKLRETPNDRVRKSRNDTRAIAVFPFAFLHLLYPGTSHSPYERVKGSAQFFKIIAHPQQGNREPKTEDDNTGNC